MRWLIASGRARRVMVGGLLGETLRSVAPSSVCGDCPVADRGTPSGGGGIVLAALLLVGIVAAPLSSAALFLPRYRPRQVAGAWPAARRFALAVLGTLL